MLTLAPRHPPLRPQWSSHSLGTPATDSPGRMGTAPFSPLGRDSRHPGMGLLVPGGPHPGPAAIWAGPLSVLGAVLCAVPGLHSLWIPRVHPPPSAATTAPGWSHVPWGAESLWPRRPAPHHWALACGIGWEDPGCLHDPRHLWLPVLAARAGPAPACPSHGPLSDHMMVSSTFWTSESRHPSRLGKAPSRPCLDLYPRTADSGDAGP